jgi:hypothetical protein
MVIPTLNISIGSFPGTSLFYFFNKDSGIITSITAPRISIDEKEWKIYCV